MKQLLITTLIAFAVVACSKEMQTSTPAAAKETTYPMTATIVSRDPAKNTVNLDNKEVPGEMAAFRFCARRSFASARRSEISSSWRSDSQPLRSSHERRHGQPNVA